MTNKTALPLCFIDARGGDFARLAAAVAHSIGLSDTVAAAFGAEKGEEKGEEKPLSDDVKTVLDEVGMTTPSAAPFENALTSKHLCVWLGDGSHLEAGPNTQVWPAALRSPDEPIFNRLVAARILRDDLAKRIRSTSSR